MTNGLGATDEPLVHWRYARYRRELLKLGVEIYELSPELARDAGRFGNFRKSFGRLHAKVAVIDRRQLFVGSLNLDQRSAWSNTEAGLLIDSPRLADDIVALLENDHKESVYQLRLGADGESIEWVVTGADGSERVLAEEPHNNWLLRLKMWVIGPLTSEDLL
jgi:putative cardiolipin synthase